MTIVRKREVEMESPGLPPEGAAESLDELDRALGDFQFKGEVVDEHTAQRLSLAFGALNKFPDLVRRHRRFVGGATATAVISTSAIILAYRAVHSRMANGESAAEALKGVTEDEIERSVGLLRRIRRR